MEGLILLRTWTYIPHEHVERGHICHIWEQNWKELIICVIEDAFGVLVERIRYKERMGL